jgi:hypothetical protein
VEAAAEDAAVKTATEQTYRTRGRSRTEPNLLSPQRSALFVAFVWAGLLADQPFHRVQIQKSVGGLAQSLHKPKKPAIQGDHLPVTRGEITNSSADRSRTARRHGRTARGIKPKKKCAPISNVKARVLFCEPSGRFATKRINVNFRYCVQQTVLLEGLLRVQPTVVGWHNSAYLA